MCFNLGNISILWKNGIKFYTKFIESRSMLSSETPTRVMFLRIICFSKVERFFLFIQQYAEGGFDDLRAVHYDIWMCYIKQTR